MFYTYAPQEKNMEQNLQTCPHEETPRFESQFLVIITPASLFLPFLHITSLYYTHTNPKNYMQDKMKEEEAHAQIQGGINQADKLSIITHMKQNNTRFIPNKSM